MPDFDLCQRIKCGAVPQSAVDVMTLYECSVQYGAGVLRPCSPECVPYGVCQPAPPLPLPLSAEPTQMVLTPVVTPIMPVVTQTESIIAPTVPTVAPPLPITTVAPPPVTITPQTIVPPPPDIIGMFPPMVYNPGPCGEGGWAKANLFINENPVCALVMLAAAGFVVAALKKN